MVKHIIFRVNSQQVWGIDQQFNRKKQKIKKNPDAGGCRSVTTRLLCQEVQNIIPHASSLLITSSHIVGGKDHTAGLARFTWIVTSFWTSIPRSSSPGFQGEGSLCWLVMIVWTGSGPLTDEGSRSVISDAALSSSASCRVELVSLVYRVLLGNRGALSPGSSWPGITKLKRRLVILVSP